MGDFLADFGSEERCEQALFAIRRPEGRARWQRNGCKRQVSLLAGAIFQSTKLPPTTWFLAMYLLSETGNGISALEPGLLRA